MTNILFKYIWSQPGQMLVADFHFGSISTMIFLNVLPCALISVFIINGGICKEKVLKRTLWPNETDRNSQFLASKSNMWQVIFENYFLYISLQGSNGGIYLDFPNMDNGFADILCSPIVFISSFWHIRISFS